MNKTGKRVILHCDCNSFFASVETALNRGYIGVPMAVCGSTEDRHGIVLAKNELAKQYGIKTAETVYSAKKVTGIKNVSASLAKDCTLVLNIDTTLESGNAEVVVIMDDEIVDRFNAGEQKTFEYSVSGEHKFYVRILCEEAKISITTTREFK